MAPVPPNRRGIMEEDPLKLWQHVHGASVHFPVALAVVSALFDLGALALRRDTFRTVGFWCLIAATVVAVPALLSGLAGQLGWFGIEKWEAENLIRHRNLAFVCSGALLVLSVWRIAARDRASTGARVLQILIAVAAATSAGWTGYLGAYVARGY